MAYIPLSEPDEEDDPSEVIDDPHYVRDLITRIESSPNYLTPEQRNIVNREKARFLNENVIPFRNAAEAKGIKLSSTPGNISAIITETANLDKDLLILPEIVEYFLKFDQDTWSFKFGQLLATSRAGEVGARALVKGFETKPNRWHIASFLESNPHPSVASDVIRLLKDRNYGHSRQPLTYVLAKTRDPLAFDVLAQLIDDPDLTGQVIEALGTVNDLRAVPPIEPHLRHEKPWIRKAAAKVIKKLQNSKPATVQ